MKKKILIIDDEVHIRDLLEQFFTGLGYDVTTAASAAAALASVQRSTPDLVMSDLQLEDADGLEMIAQLKKLLPTTPVILLTGVLFDADIIRDVLHKQVAAYLPKTSSLSRILDEVRHLLGAADRPTGQS
jgi:DNA-binding NtrC family response regulator